MDPVWSIMCCSLHTAWIRRVGFIPRRAPSTWPSMWCMFIFHFLNSNPSCVSRGPPARARTPLDSPTPGLFRTRLHVPRVQEEEDRTQHGIAVLEGREYAFPHGRLPLSDHHGGTGKSKNQGMCGLRSVGRPKGAAGVCERPGRRWGGRVYDIGRRRARKGFRSGSGGIRTGFTQFF